MRDFFFFFLLLLKNRILEIIISQQMAKLISEIPTLGKVLEPPQVTTTHLRSALQPIIIRKNVHIFASIMLPLTQTLGSVTSGSSNSYQV